jgi:hypothetical protein
MRKKLVRCLNKKANSQEEPLELNEEQIRLWKANYSHNSRLKI